MRKLKYVKMFENFQVNEELFGFFKKKLYFYIHGEDKTETGQEQRQQIVENLKKMVKNQIIDRKNTTRSEIIKNSDDLIYKKFKAIPLNNLGVDEHTGVRTNDVQYGLSVKTYQYDVTKETEQEPTQTFQLVRFTKTLPNKNDFTGLLVGNPSEPVFVIYILTNNDFKGIAQITQKDFEELVDLHKHYSNDLYK